MLLTGNFLKNYITVNMNSGPCDGSSCDIFLNSEDKDNFEPNGSYQGFDPYQCYVFLDKRFTDILVQPARKRNEVFAFCSMVDSADIPEQKVIFFGDRGYTSYNRDCRAVLPYPM